MLIQYLTKNTKFCFILSWLVVFINVSNSDDVLNDKIDNLM